MITSTSNQKVKEIIQLEKKAKARRERQVFVVEGHKMVGETPAELLEEIYVSESFLQREEAALLEGKKYELVSDRVFESMSDTKTPQGILAVVRMPHYEMEDFTQKEKGLFLILESIQDPGNLGTMFRTGEGASVTGIIMNRTTVDLFHPKTTRSTMGSIFRVPFLVVDDLTEAIQTLQSHGTRVYAAHLKGKHNYNEEDYGKSTAFLIGNEGNGLSDEIADLADCYIKIPMGGQLESLNAAMASGILMYEAGRQRHFER